MTKSLKSFDIKEVYILNLDKFFMIFKEGSFPFVFSTFLLNFDFELNLVELPTFSIFFEFV